MPRGKKTCPECGEHTAPRSKVCACGFKFAIKKKSPKKQPKPPEVEKKEVKTEDKPKSDHNLSGNIFVSNIQTPNGACPAKPHGYASGSFPDGYTDDTIKEWTRSLRSHGRGLGVNYMPAAIKYWARFFWNIHSNEFKEVCKTIDMSFAPSEEKPPVKTDQD